MHSGYKSLPSPAGDSPGVDTKTKPLNHLQTGKLELWLSLERGSKEAKCREDLIGDQKGVGAVDKANELP